MIGFLVRLVGGAVSPLVDQVTSYGAGLLRKLALFLVAALCMVVVVIALTLAFGFWIGSLAGPVVGALAVAGVYLAVAVAAVVVALRKPRGAVTRDDSTAPAEAAAADDKKEQVDRFAAPLLAILSSLGLRREQIAVLAGASLAKQLNPMAFVGLAIVAGFLVGRLWKGWDALISSDVVETLLAMIVPGRPSDEPATDGPIEGEAPEVDRAA